MFVNAALIRPGHEPGQYPSGGPLPHLVDVWRAAARASTSWRPTSTSRTSPSGPAATGARATRCSSRRRCAARRRRSTGSTRSARTTRSASRRSASRRSASRPQGTSRPATTSWRSSSRCSSTCRARAGRRACCRKGRSSGSPSRCASGAGSWRRRSRAGRAAAAGRRGHRPDGRPGRPAAAFWRARPRDRARRVPRRRDGGHPHVRGERPRQARGDPQRRGGTVCRGALGKHPLAERRPDPPGAPRAARARALLDPEGEARPLLG